MLRMKLVDFDPGGTAGPRASRSIPLTVALAGDTHVTVWITDLATQVVNGVLTATGTATLPGQDSDTFTAQLREDPTSDDRLMVTLEFGSLRMDPLDFAIDMSHLQHGRGATTVPGPVSLLMTGLGP